jgi:single-strand DNA-binding protein
MSQGGYVTLIGFVAREPDLRHTPDGRPVADVRIGATTRYYDKTRSEWRDGDTSYFTVNCWRRLADHAKLSLRKGDPVIVKGRFRTHTYQDKQGRIRTEVEIVADSVGHDLSRGTANYIRPTRPRLENVDDDLADSDVADAPADALADAPAGGDAGAGYPDDPGAEGSMAASGAPPYGGPGSSGGGPGSSGDRINEEEAVDEFNRELNRELAEDGQFAGTGPAARDLTESAPDESEEPAGEPLPF